jgi:drug/metabolite transporter (DMT)-like permease
MRTAAGVVIGFLGVGIAVFSAGQHPGAIRAEGVILVAGGALSYAVATALAKSRLRNLDPLGLATTQLAVGTVLMIPVALFTPAPGVITTQSVAAIAALGIMGTGVAYLLYYALLARVSAVQVQAVTYILPVWGLFWGFLAGEPIGWLSAVGVVVVLSGLTLLRR